MSSDLIDLVRQVLPAPAPARSWEVIPVESYDEAGADVDFGVVRVAKTWRESVFESGLSRVGRHYPLAVETFEEVDPRAVLQNLRIQWRGYHLYVARTITIEDYWRAGCFTGDLISGQAFIAKIGGERQMFAEPTARAAVMEALKAYRGLERQARGEKRKLIQLRNSACKLISQLDSGRPYDSDRDCIAIASYESLLPQSQVDLLKFYGSEGVPLPILKHACIESIAEMERGRILELVVQLGWDASAAQASFKRRSRLTSEDERVLKALQGVPLD